MQQIRQNLAVVRVGGGDGGRMNQAALTVHTDMALDAEVPRVAFLGLVYLGVAPLVLVLGRRLRSDDGGVHDGAAQADVGTSGSWFRSVPHRSPDRCRQKCASPSSQEGFFGQVEPPLQQVHSDHDPQSQKFDWL